MKIQNFIKKYNIIFQNKIFPNNKESEFHITPGLFEYNDNLKSKNISEDLALRTYSARLLGYSNGDVDECFVSMQADIEKAIDLLQNG